MITVHSTWGDLAVVESTGFVVKADSVYFEEQEQLPPGSETCDGDIRRIVRFDVGEYRHFYGVQIPGEVDILDVGYWTEDGHYEPPCYEWRMAPPEGKEQP